MYKLGLITTLGSGHPSPCPGMALFLINSLVIYYNEKWKKNLNPVNLKLTLTLTYSQPFASLLPVALPLSVLTTIGNFVFHPFFGCVHACVSYILNGYEVVCCFLLVDPYEIAFNAFSDSVLFC